MNTIPAKPDHFDLLEFRAEEAELIDQFGIDKAKAMLSIGVSNTLTHDGRILAIVGAYTLWSGVLEVWVVPSHYVTQYPFVYLKYVKKYVQTLLNGYQPHRMQTQSLNNALHDRWMDFLGFTKEGIMKQFGADKQDYALWSIVK